MKKITWIVFFTLILTHQAHALIILTKTAINFNTKSGVLKGNVVLGNKIQKAIAIGNYKISSNGKNVVFNISSIAKDNQKHNLSSQPTLIKPIKSQRFLKKGSKLILAGENQEEIAKIFGISLEDYQKKSGTKATSSKGSSGNSSSSLGSSSGGSSSSSSSGTSGSGSSMGGFGSNSSSGSDYGSSYIPNSSSGNGGTNYYPIPNSSSSKDEKNIGSDNVAEYSTQFCKSPAYNGKNSIGLSFIAKDGSCVDIQAQRDDTKCEYRYDFNDGVAIKQTQFYYVDNENQTKNVGGCIDLQGNEYRFPLYKDDSKCQLQVIKDKGYKGNQAYFFQTQILFRGADGLVHMAQDCSDYQNVQEELIDYDKDSKTKQLKRVVNQYYIDPQTGDKVYINNGIISPFKFLYQEYACGDWEMDDANLQAYRRTQIKSFDNITNKYIDITSCDYSNDEGKSGRITLPYIKLANNEKAGEAEKYDMNGEYEFELKERIANFNIQNFPYGCRYLWSNWTRSRDIAIYSNGGFKTLTKWKTTYKTINTGITIGYQRPKQEDELEASIYYISKRVKTIDRTVKVIQNDLNLNADYMKFYEAKTPYKKNLGKVFKGYAKKDGNCLRWELEDRGDEYCDEYEQIDDLSKPIYEDNIVDTGHSYYQDETYLTSDEFKNFVTKYYKPNAGGLCLMYGFGPKWFDNGANCSNYTINNANYFCINYNNYLLPTP